MKKLIVLILLILQTSLCCLAQDELLFKQLKTRQVESPVYYSNGFSNTTKETTKTPLMRGKHHSKTKVFKLSVSKSNYSKDVKEKGLVTSFKPFNLSKSSGDFTIGSTYYGSENIAKDIQNNTYGVFSTYKIGRFSFQTKYTRYTDRNFENPDDNLYFTPRVILTRNLALKVRHRKKMEVENYKNDFILEYSLANNPILRIKNMKLELTASYINNENHTQEKQLGARAKYYF